MNWVYKEVELDLIGLVKKLSWKQSSTMSKCIIIIIIIIMKSCNLSWNKVYDERICCSFKDNVFDLSLSYKVIRFQFFMKVLWLLKGKSGFVSHTKLTAEATFMDLFHSWLITRIMWFWEFENKIAYLGAVKFKTKD